MKKLTTILLLIVYSSLGLGIAINYHYCSGHLTEVSVLNFGGQGGCGCDKTDMPTDCCKDKIKYAKGDNHKMVPLPSLQRNYSFNLELQGIANNIINSPAEVSSDNNGFMLLNTRSFPRSIYLFNKVFRI